MSVDDRISAKYDPRATPTLPGLADLPAEVGDEDRTATNGDARAKPFATYPGSKDAAGVAERIIRLFPPHSLYVDAFLGGGAVFRRKPPALASIGIDADARVIKAWRRLDSPGLTIVRGDALRWLAKHGPNLPADALVYADPPYMHATRSHRRLYRYELSDAQHRRLLEVLDSLSCSIVISGYMHPLYAERLSTWGHDEFPAMTRGGVRTEHVWYRLTLAGFGVAGSHAGRNFRERERIKRKARRWSAKFRGMQREEQSAVLRALLADYSGNGVDGRPRQK